MQARADRWQGLDDSTVIRLVLSDLDGMETSVNHLAETVEAKLSGLTKVLIGILVSMTTASILLAVNLAVGGAP